MSSVVLVTATSFMKSDRLRSELETGLTVLSSPPEIHYLDLRNLSSRTQFLDPQFASRVSSWLVGGERVSETELLRFPRLQQISKYGVGLDNIDFEACRARGVTVYFEPGVNSLAVAEHSLGLIIGMIRNLFHNSGKLRGGVWNKDGGRGLAGLKVGLVGLGHVGSKVAKLLSLLGAELSYCDIEAKPVWEKSLALRRLSFDDLLMSSELVSFHVPLTDQTFRMMDERAFALCRDGFFLVNTSRGSIIDEKALKRALASGKLGGAALDVFEDEPLHDKELAGYDRFFGTPHTAGNSEQAVAAMGQAAICGIIRYYSLPES